MYAHRDTRDISRDESAPAQIERSGPSEPEPSNSELAEQLTAAGGEGDGDGSSSPASYVRRRGDAIRLRSFSPASTVEANPGEEIWLTGLFDDIDEHEHGRRVSGEDFYDIDWTATSGCFDRPGGPSTAQDNYVDNPGPYPFSRRYLTGDVAAAPITVEATIRDRSSHEEARDRDLDVIWTVLPRQNSAPASIEQLSFERRGPSEYVGRYRVGPDGGSGQYNRQVVQEHFEDPRPVQMTAEDIIPHGFMDDPQSIVTLLAGGAHGTFSCDDSDEFTDYHGGFGDLDLEATFRPEALTRGISWSVVQTYTSGGAIIGRFLITRTLQGTTMTITKEPV